MLTPLFPLLLCAATAGGSPSPVQAYEEGQIAGALKLAQARLALPDLPQASRGLTRLVEAFALLRLGRASAAKKSLDVLASEGPDLGPYVHTLRCRAAAALGSCASAADAARNIPATSVFAADAWRHVSKCFMRAGDTEHAGEAVERLEAVATTESALGEAMVLRARLTELAGDLQAAGDLYRTVLVDFPLSSAARTAREKLAQLKRQGAQVAPLDAEDLLPVAENERGLLQPEAARRIYRNVLAQSKKTNRPDLAQQAELGLVELDVVDQRYPKALARLERVLAVAKDPGVRAEALYLRGDLLSRQGRVREALAAYGQTQSETPDAPFALVAALSAARLAYTVRDLPLARRSAQWLLARPAQDLDINFVRDDGVRGATSTTELRDSALWLLAWMEHAEHAPAEHMDSYLAAISADGDYAPAALYWRARLAVDNKDLEACQVFVNLLTARAPASFYALLGTDLLRRALPASAAGTLPLPASPGDDGGVPARPSAQPADLKGALVLFESGLHSEARRVLKLLPMQSLSDADRVVAAYLYRRCGEIHRAAVLTRQAATQPEQLEPAVLDLAFPRPYAPIVAAAAKDYGVPQALIYAIMREESAFNPLAVSPRQALGLMQMIKPTALRLAKEADIRRFRSRQLFNPEVSIRLGTFYLAVLLQEMDGNLVATAAAYQAGERAVHRWLSTRRSLRPDEFVEEIPFSSTRLYVRKVLASYAVYRMLEGIPADEAMQLTKG
jgi:soluble lytic murein transglycosylase